MTTEKRRPFSWLLLPVPGVECNLPVVRVKTALPAFFLLFFLSSCTLSDDPGKLIEKGLHDLNKRHYKQSENNLARAAVLLEKANEKTDGFSKGEALKLATVYSYIGKSKFQQGAFDAAIPWYLRAIETYTRFNGEKLDSFLVSQRHALSTCYFKQGNFRKAQELAEQELDYYAATLGKANVRTAISANNLAQIYEKLGEPEEAERYFQWAMNLTELIKKDCVPIEVDILNNYALFCRKQGEFAKARELVMRAIKILDRNCDKHVDEKVKSLLVLAEVYKSTYEIESAEDAYRQALSLLYSEKQSNDSLKCEALDNYASLLLADRKFLEAEPLFDRCLQECMKAHGTSHPSYANKLEDVSLLYRRTGRFLEAEQKLKQALEINEQSLGPWSKETLATLNKLTAVLEDQKKYSEADSLYNEWIPKLTATLGPNHPYVADTLNNQAMFVEHTQGIENADELRKKAQEIRGHKLRIPERLPDDFPDRPARIPTHLG